MWEYKYADELYHYGVKGQKWGVRRYQDYDGRLKRGHEKRYGEWPPKGSEIKRNPFLQKKDGSLTRRGEKKIEESGTLYFPARDKKRGGWKGKTENRFKAADTFKDPDYTKVWEHEKNRLLNDKSGLKKAGYIFTDNPDSDVREHNDDLLYYLVMNTSAVKEAERKRTEKYIDYYANATLADLGLQNTKQAKIFVKEHLSKSVKR